MQPTHRFFEAGNGFPSEGDLVVEGYEDGFHVLLRVVELGRIVTGHAMRGDPAAVDVRCEPVEVSLDDLDDDYIEHALREALREIRSAGELRRVVPLSELAKRH